MRLDSKPIPIFGYDYFATGSISYEGLERKTTGRPYYVVSVDYSDHSLFWAILAHELAHCKLSETDHMENLFSTLRKKLVDVELIYFHWRRTEQTMSDIIGIRLLCPAYVYSYMTRLRPVFPPECMAEVLEDAGLSEIAREARRMRDERFAGSWDSEDISPLKDEMIRASEDFPLLIDGDVLFKSKMAQPEAHRK